MLLHFDIIAYMTIASEIKSSGLHAYSYLSTSFRVFWEMSPNGQAWVTCLPLEPTALSVRKLALA